LFQKGPRGFSICKKIKADIKIRKKNVKRGDTVKIFVRLMNLSGGDVDDGRWFIVLPEGVTYTGSSLTSRLTELSLNVYAWDPVIVHTKKREYFSLSVFIEDTASDRLVFRSFLEDPEDYCEATSALTVRLVQCFPPRGLILSIYSTLCFCRFSIFCFLHLTLMSLSYAYLSYNSLRLKSRERNWHPRLASSKASSITDSSNLSSKELIPPSLPKHHIEKGPQRIQ
jgi:hypothetical protein